MGGQGSRELPSLGRGGTAPKEWDEVKVSKLLRKWGRAGGEGRREEGRGAVLVVLYLVP